MKFVDSIDELKLHLWSSYFTKKKSIRACNQLIKQYVSSVDLIRSLIDDAEAQIKKWEEIQKKNPKLNFDKEINLFKIIADFFRLNGRLITIELDVKTAYKYLLNAKSEYEYRFFARRIYTLLYESNRGLGEPVGSMYSKLENIVDEKYFNPYKCAKKDLFAFFYKHKDEFQDVRNKNEAHKYADFEEQLASIENLSVAKSIELIQEGDVYLYNLNCAFMIVQQSLMKYLGEIVSEKINNI